LSILYSRTIKSFIIAIMMTALSTGLTLAADAGPKRIAVLPFTIHAGEDMTFLQNGILDMLSSRLVWEDKVTVISKGKTLDALNAVSGEMNESLARTVGSAVGADYVLFGSLTIFGNSVSIDSKLVDVTGNRPAVSLYRQSQGMDTVIPRINGFADEINQTVFGRKPVIAAAPAAPQPPADSSIYMHPEKQYAQGRIASPGQPQTGSPFILQQGSSAGDFWKSRNLKLHIKSMTLGDITGDGRLETIVMASQRIQVFTCEQGRLIKRAEFEGKPYQQFVAVDAADVKPDGKAELFVTCLNANRSTLDSFALEWNGNALTQTVSGQNWYYRVLPHPERGRILLGQKRGVTDIFLPDAWELGWDGTGYQPLESVRLPRDANIYRMARGDITNTDTDMILTFDAKDRLQLFSPSGEAEWKGDDSYGGSETYLPHPTATESPKPLYLAQRILVSDLDADGNTEVILVNNQSMTGRLFKGYRQYNSGTFTSLAWDGLGLSPVWTTRKVSGYISDYAVGDFNHDGTPELVATVVSRRKSIARQPKSAIIAYSLEAFSR